MLFVFAGEGIVCSLNQGEDIWCIQWVTKSENRQECMSLLTRSHLTGKKVAPTGEDRDTPGQGGLIVHVSGRSFTGRTVPVESSTAHHHHPLHHTSCREQLIDAFCHFCLGPQDLVSAIKAPSGFEASKC